MTFRTLQGADLKGKTALVRVDFNVPMEDGKVSDDTRLKAALPTIGLLSEAGAKTVLLAHFDRPKGKRVPEMSLKPVLDDLAALVGKPVAWADDCIGEAAQSTIRAMKPGEVVLLENVRFHAGEEKNDPAFAAEMAKLGDIYVNDAFSAAHRAHASTEGLARLLPAYPGVAMERELNALELALGKPERPVMGIVGGSKVSTKLDLLKNLVTKLDKLAIGGGMANTFLYAQGHDVGASYCEKDLAETAREIIRLAGHNNCKLFLPLDIVVAEQMASGVPTRVRNLGNVDDHERILDAGPETVARLKRAMANSKTLVWNG
ncbi:MAG: phosphoglycerate kinase, partial [Pseudomonadota bacterium]